MHNCLGPRNLESLLTSTKSAWILIRIPQATFLHGGERIPKCQRRPIRGKLPPPSSLTCSPPLPGTWMLHQHPAAPTPGTTAMMTTAPLPRQLPAGNMTKKAARRCAGRQRHCDDGADKTTGDGGDIVRKQTSTPVLLRTQTVRSVDANPTTSPIFDGDGASSYQ